MGSLAWGALVQAQEQGNGGVQSGKRKVAFGWEAGGAKAPRTRAESAAVCSSNGGTGALASFSYLGQGGQGGESGKRKAEGGQGGRMKLPRSEAGRSGANGGGSGGVSTPPSLPLSSPHHPPPPPDMAGGAAARGEKRELDGDIGGVAKRRVVTSRWHPYALSLFVGRVSGCGARGVT